jgi:hypothetical protein
MRRMFLTVRGKRCAFGCTYCFADFSQYNGTPSLEDVECGAVDMTGVDVVYPACDVDLFALTKRWEDIIERTAGLERSISISTKAMLSNEQITTLTEWASLLHTRGQILKIGISASTMSRCNELEPRAASWTQRLDNLSRLRDAGVPSCLVLKPLLSEISTDEYRDMIKAGSAYTSAAILGDEYVDDALAARRPSDADISGALASREVNWLSGRPRWLVREAGDRLFDLARHAHECRVDPYLSDLDYMDALTTPAPGCNSWVGEGKR